MAKECSENERKIRTPQSYRRRNTQHLALYNPLQRTSSRQHGSEARPPSQGGTTIAPRFTSVSPTLNTRHSLDARALGLMVMLCLLWSLQQITLKATAADFSPMLHIGVRSGLSAVLVALLMLWRGERLTVAHGVWRLGMLAGALFAVEYLLVAEALRLTSAAHAVVFLYTSPLFAALGLHWKLPAERLTPLQWLGIALAFAGVAVAFLLRTPHTPGPGQHMLLGDALALLGGASWGATTVVIRTTRINSLPATQSLLYQLLMAFALLVPVALWTGQNTFHPTPVVLANLAFQAVIVAFLSFLLWFWLLGKYLASRLGVLTFMTPMFGVVLGAWLLIEPIEGSFMVGAALVLGGVVLVSGHGWLMQIIKKRSTN